MTPDELVPCYAVRWQQDGRWHSKNFAVEVDAMEYRFTLPDRSAYVVSTTAARRDVVPAMVQ